MQKCGEQWNHHYSEYSNHAPALIRTSATLVFPNAAAVIKAVEPSVLVALIFAPASN